MANAQSNVNARAIQLGALVQRLDAPSNSLTGPRLPDMTQSFAHEDVTFKVVVAAWSYIVWAPLLDKDNAINRVLSIIDSPWHSILESLTIAKIFSAIHKELLDRRKTRALADCFLANTIQWILDDVRTVWQLPIPKGSPAKRPEKANRKDENTIGAPTVTQLRLYSALFADLYAVQLVEPTTFLDILTEILNNPSSNLHKDIIVLDIMCRASTIGMPKIPSDLWKKAMEEAGLNAAQSKLVGRFVKDAGSANKTCRIKKWEVAQGHDTLIAKRCIDIQREIEKLDGAD